MGGGGFSTGASYSWVQSMESRFEATLLSKNCNCELKMFKLIYLRFFRDEPELMFTLELEEWDLWQAKAPYWSAGGFTQIGRRAFFNDFQSCWKSSTEPINLFTLQTLHCRGLEVKMKEGNETVHNFCQRNIQNNVCRKDWTIFITEKLYTLFAVY